MEFPVTELTVVACCSSAMLVVTAVEIVLHTSACTSNGAVLTSSDVTTLGTCRSPLACLFSYASFASSGVRSAFM